MSHRYRGTVKNVDATSEGACTEYPKSTKLGFGVFSEGWSRGSQVEEAWGLALVV